MRLLFVAFCLFAYASLASAAVTTPGLDAARQLLNEGKTEQALALLEKNSPNLIGNEEFDYLLGQAYLQAGKTGQAYFAFERVLMVNPNNADARLKAARISTERGDTVTATTLMQPLARQQLNPAQQQEAAKIRALIAAASSTSKTSLRGYILAGAGTDSNITAGPDKDALLIPLFSPPPPNPPTLTAMGTSQQQSDHTGIVDAGLSLRKAVNQDTWLTADGNARLGFNRERRDVAESYANLNLGVLRKVGRDYLGAAVLGQDYLLDNINYRNTLGGKLNWIHSLNTQSWLTAYVQLLNFVYPDHEIDNARRSIAGLSYEAAAEGNAKTFLIGIYGGKEEAQDPSKPHFSYNLWGANIGSNIMLSKKLSLSAGLMYESRQHTAVDALYFITRKDSQISAAISADYRMGERWHMVPLYTYTQTTSNTELYAYNRTTFMLQFKREFDNE